MSQPVGACEPGLEDLSKLTAPAYFFGVKLMFVGVVKFGQVQKIRFVSVKIFGHILSNFLSYLIGHVNQPHFFKGVSWIIILCPQGMSIFLATNAFLWNMFHIYIDGSRAVYCKSLSFIGPKMNR